MPHPKEPPALTDTSPEALALRYSILRRMTTEQRLAMMDHLTSMARTIMREGLRRRHPHASAEEIEHLFCEALYGREIAERVRERRGRSDSTAGT